MSHRRFLNTHRHALCNEPQGCRLPMWTVWQKYPVYSHQSLIGCNGMTLRVIAMPQGLSDARDSKHLEPSCLDPTAVVSAAECCMTTCVRKHCHAHSVERSYSSELSKAHPVAAM